MIMKIVLYTLLLCLACSSCKTNKIPQNIEFSRKKTGTVLVTGEGVQDLYVGPLTAETKVIDVLNSAICHTGTDLQKIVVYRRSMKGELIQYKLKYKKECSDGDSLKFQLYGGDAIDVPSGWRSKYFKNKSITLDGCFLEKGSCLYRKNEK